MTPEWWSKYDNPILELLADCGIAVTPAVVRFNLAREMIAPPHRSTVNRRLDILSTYGFVERVDDPGYYEITEKGEQHIAGELSAEAYTNKPD